MDQVTVKASRQNKSTITVYADPKARGYNDLLTKGGQFYAVYDPDSHFWNKNLSELSRLIDDDIDSFVNAYELPEGVANLDVKFMNNMSNGMWNRYLTQMKGLTDSRVQLDQTVRFDNDDIKREDYASFKEPYSLEEAPIPNYEKLMSRIYDEDQRRKLEWGIGLLVDGKSVKRTQKFFVICGDPGTGKSTILNIMEELFDGYISYFNAKELGQGYTFATAAFKDAPLVAIQTDGDLSHLYDNTAINQISGHETILVNEKGIKQYPVDLKTMMFMATNKPVRITDAQSGIIRRLIDIYPSNKTLSNSEYFEAMDAIRFELGGIAWHCREVFRSMGPNAYGSYVAKSMIARTNDVYSFLSSQLDEFETDKPISASNLWHDFKIWCDEANIDVRLKRDEFVYEVRNYFEDMNSSMVNGRRSNRNVTFTKFKWSKFETEGDASEEKPEILDAPELVFDKTESLLDKVAADCPAQYASNSDIGGPLRKWDECNTTLSQLDTKKLHWVRVPDNHIVIDFDIKNENGEKDREANLKAAAQYPPTYGEFSKSGNGVHLHYIYDGDVTRLKPVIDLNVECKVYTKKSALRRRLSFCNDLPIAHISSGLPLRGEKSMINDHYIKDEKHIRNLIKGGMKKQYVPSTKQSIDFICMVLDEAYEQGIKYNVSDMRDSVLNFALASVKNSDYCVQVVGNMKFKSADEEIPEPVKPEDNSILTFYDVEVFSNLFMICYKNSNSDDIKTLINPTASDVRGLSRLNLIGFNNRKYDNHMLYARGWLDYSIKDLYELSRKIVSGDRDALFPNAYNLSYTDIYDFASKKQSLKKWEIELGIDHHELGMDWNKPVDPKQWELVASYCRDDVRATEAVFNARHEDFVARQGLANLSGLTVNDTSNQHSTRIIFGDAKNPQKVFPFPDLADTFPGYTFDPFRPKDSKSEYQGEFPGEGGYVWVYGMPNGNGPDYHVVRPAIGRSRDERIADMEQAYSECLGVSLAEKNPDMLRRMQQLSDNPLRDIPNRGVITDNKGKEVLGGMFGNIALLDIASMHPTSIEVMNFFGPFTSRFSDIKKARIDIKHGNLDEAKKRMNGALAPLLKEGEDTSGLAGALKIIINSVYGLTSAHFPTKFNDVAAGTSDRNKDNKVAKRGALFMIGMKHVIQNLGYTVVHVKTDSVKIADADEFIVQFVMDYGKHYGYDFELESIYDRMCIVNKSTYIAHVCYGKHTGSWSPTGAQFLHPYVLKALFTKEPITFRDTSETKSATTSIFLDFNEGLPEGEHKYDFIGKVSAFTPVRSGCGGGILLRKAKEDKYSAVTGSKGYRWKESSVMRDGKLEDQLDDGYYNELANAAVDEINLYGDYGWFVDLDQTYLSPNVDSNEFVSSKINEEKEKK